MRQGWDRFRNAFALAPVALLAMSGRVFASGSNVVQNTVTNSTVPPLPTMSPIDISSSPIAMGLFQVFKFGAPIIGAYIIIRVIWEAMVAISKAASGQSVQAGNLIGYGNGSLLGSAVMHRMIELGVAVLLLVLFMSGLWVELLNAVFTFGINMVNSVIHALH